MRPRPSCASGQISEIQKLRGAGHIVAMAGDGIMTLPLWRLPMWASPWAPHGRRYRELGITSWKAIARIVKAIRLSHLVMRNIRQNLFFAFILHVLGVPGCCRGSLSIHRHPSEPYGR